MVQIVHLEFSGNKFLYYLPWKINARDAKESSVIYFLTDHRPDTFFQK